MVNAIEITRDEFAKRDEEKEGVKIVWNSIFIFCAFGQGDRKDRICRRSWVLNIPNNAGIMCV
jgi:hypothetical protein